MRVVSNYSKAGLKQWLKAIQVSTSGLKASWRGEEFRQNNIPSEPSCLPLVVWKKATTTTTTTPLNLR